MAMARIVLMMCFVALMGACNSNYTTGKKKGHHQIEFPARKYQKFEKAGVPYTFEYPVYAKIVQDSNHFERDPESAQWYNVDFPDFGARIFLSYKEVGGRAMYKVKKENGQYVDSFGINIYDKMVADAFVLTNKNEAKASSIKEDLIQTPKGINGIFFKVGGDAASAQQFFLTDTTRNFIRGALYFGVSPNADSLKIVNDFLYKDIEHLINTFEWLNKK